MLFRKFYDNSAPDKMNKVEKAANEILGMYEKSQSETLVVIDCRDQFSNYRRRWITDRVYCIMVTGNDKDVSDIKTEPMTAGVVSSPFYASVEIVREVITKVTQKSIADKIHILATSGVFFQHFFDLCETKQKYIQFYKREEDLVKCVDRVAPYNGPRCQYSITYFANGKTEAEAKKEEHDLEEFISGRYYYYNYDGTVATLKVVEDSLTYTYKAVVHKLQYVAGNGVNETNVRRHLSDWNFFCNQQNVDAQIYVINEEPIKEAMRLNALHAADIKPAAEKLGNLSVGDFGNGRPVVNKELIEKVADTTDRERIWLFVLKYLTQKAFINERPVHMPFNLITNTFPRQSTIGIINAVNECDYFELVRVGDHYEVSTKAEYFYE